MGLVLTDVTVPEEDLARQVGSIDPIKVGDHEVTNAGIREVEAGDRTESAEACHQHTRLFQPTLPAFANLGQSQVPAVPDRVYLSH